MPNADRNSATPVHLRMHPRVFAALGADLVTNDVVAVIELVKNSYDAYAKEVWVRLGVEVGEAYMEIEDDGHGMTEEVIRDAWCLVATPYKEFHREVVRDGATRRVSGQKGLGRLSVGRLGQRLTLLTKAEGHPCLQVDVDWAELAAGDDIGNSTVNLRRRTNTTLRRNSGTLLRIHALESPWDDDQREELKENLERLISPFGDVDDFKVHFATTADDGEQIEATISSPSFLATPKYWISGRVDDRGDVNALYKYHAIATDDQRDQRVTVPWHRIHRSADFRPVPAGEPGAVASCGPFSFDIRAWDISREGVREVADRYGIQRSHIRATIQANKGISVYRDGVLVLPKSDGALDWLGLDLRRVSRVGDRLSTNQLVGYVSISADGNPGIKDTSDRERLAVSPEVREFQAILKAIIGELEKERDQDRIKYSKETPMEDLLVAVSATDAIRDVRQLAEAGGSARKAIPVLRRLHKSLVDTRKKIERRFVYYSRLATIGTVAHMLVHEIRNRTTAIGRFLRLFGRMKAAPRPPLRRSLKAAKDSVAALERLADVFSPLASRSFKRGSRTCVLEERIDACLRLQQADLRQRKIAYSIPETKTTVAVHPAELDAVILNLVSNSIYWLAEVEANNRRLEFQVEVSSDPTKVSVRIMDTGPGIEPEDMERVFWPGVTRKPDGIGMGLTVAAELVAAHGGRMAVEGIEVGASFTFDLPLAHFGGSGA